MSDTKKAPQQEERTRFDAEIGRWADAVGVMVSRHDLHGTFHYLSAASVGLLGYAPSELVGTRLGALLHPDDAAMLASEFGRRPSRLTPESVTFRVRRRDGTYRWLEVTAGVLVDIEGEPSPQVVSVLREVEANAEVDKRLRRGRGIVPSIFDRLPVIVAFVEKNGTLTYLNRCFEDLTDWPRTDLAGVWDAVYPDAEQRSRIVGTALAPPLGAVELPMLTRDGRTLTVSWVGVQLPDGSTVGFGMDVTSRVAMEAALRESEAHARRLNVELEEANRRKDEFLAVLAHELRNPLAPIANAVDAIADREIVDAAVAKARDLISEKVRHLVRLVDDLLDVARITRGVIPLRMGACDLEQVISQAVTTSRPLLEASGARFSVSVDDGPLFVHGDSTRLVQVFSNLLNNAAKYSSAGGEIHVAVARRPGRATVSVRDTGRGIATADLDHVFDLFFQSGCGEGAMGIGLALVRSIVELHGGSVTATSMGPGSGSEFLVELPTSVQPDVRTSGGPPASSTAPLPRRRVLVVDDDEAVADGFALLLESLGQEVRIALDGPQALGMIDPFDPDLVFIDLNMPGMDGYETVQLLRELPGSERRRMFALTGYGLTTVGDKVRLAGFERYVAKPASIEILDEILR